MSAGLYRRAALLEKEAGVQARLREQADVAIDLAEKTMDYKDQMGRFGPVDDRRVAEIANAAQKSVDEAVAVVEMYNSQAAAASSAEAAA